MKLITLKGWLLLLGFAITINLIAKESTNLNTGWKFTTNTVLSPEQVAYDDAAWNTVSVPHTWNAQDGQDGGNNYYRGIGWYRKHIVVPTDFAGKIVYLKIGAANTSASVYVNGQLIGAHTGGYSAFIFDVTNTVMPGQDNLIAVKVDNSATIICPPLSADFTFFGGITRDVEFVTANPVHINPNEYISNTLTMEGTNVAQPGIIIKQSNVSETSASLSILTKLRNSGASSANATVEVLLKDASGAIVQTLTDNKILNANDTLTSTVSTSVTNPHLWNGVMDPYLYKVVVSVKVNGVTTDSSVQPLGLRYFSVDPNNGFFLNGKSYPLRGICMHEEKKDKGHAVSDADRREAIDLLKETGMNYFRLSHYQHGDFTYNYLDSLGIICWAEIPDVNSVGATVEDNKIYRKNAASMMYELLRQQYNHPSVVFWGLSNEIEYQAGVDPVGTVTQLNMIVKSEDNYRLTTLAAMYSEKPSNWIPDVYSNNRYDGWYYGGIPDFGTTMDGLHTKYPTKKIGASEYGVGANVTQHELPAQLHASGQFHPEEYQNLFHEQYIAMINARPYLWSTSVWAGFDFSSDGRNEGAQPGINDKGLITFDRSVKKDAFYLYKANWNTKDLFVYISSRRFKDRTSTTNQVKVYSNCPSVSLKLNGTSLGSKTTTDHIFLWDNVVMLLGTNQVIATSTNNGVEKNDTVVWNCTNTTPAPTYPDVPAGQIQINFQKTSTTATPAGYLKDDGSIYGDRGNGYSYGWNVSLTANNRERMVATDKRFDTFMQMQTTANSSWSIALPNQWYKVSIATGDPNYTDSYNKIEANGVTIVDYVPTTANKFGAGTAYTHVTAGTLLVKPATGATNAKIDFIHITPVSDAEATAVDPVLKKKMTAFIQNGVLNIENQLSESQMVEMYNTSGQLLISKSNLPSIAKIPVENYPAGIYLLQIRSTNQTSQIKVIK
ncbi:MAG: glycoside hydrolase family 2 TIM barrel-domain containing protein [Paludibacter sp.]|nr:glycoside hydrolase family 2 TIM barrel-domain containing protein [Paludibacter sp.]